MIKVSQNRKEEEEEEEEEPEPAAGPTAAGGLVDPAAATLGGDGSGAGSALGGQPDGGDAKPKETKKKKDKEHKHRDHMSAEAEVDRIIDAQDNEYILSKPKCVETGRDLMGCRNISGNARLTKDVTVLRRHPGQAAGRPAKPAALCCAGMAHLGSLWIRSSFGT